MAAKKDEEIIVDVEEVYSKSEKWLVENQKSLGIIGGAILLLVLSYFGYQNFIYQPQEVEAQEQMWPAEKAFGIDSLDVALYGNETNYGFLDIIDNYGITKAANLAHYYAGIAYLRLGEYESAIEYLEGFDCSDELVCSVALGATGDAYMELGDAEMAIEYYTNAAENSDNDLTTPIYLMKAAQALESINAMEDALGLYNQIKSDYPNSSEGREIDKYIARASAYTGA